MTKPVPGSNVNSTRRAAGSTGASTNHTSSISTQTLSMRGRNSRNGADVIGVPNQPARLKPLTTGLEAREDASRSTTSDVAWLVMMKRPRPGWSRIVGRSAAGKTGASADHRPSAKIQIASMLGFAAMRSVEVASAPCQPIRLTPRIKLRVRVSASGGEGSLLSSGSEPSLTSSPSSMPSLSVSGLLGSDRRRPCLPG